MPRLLACLLALLGTVSLAADSGAPRAPAHASVVVIPVRDEIESPVLFVLRRGLKEAIEQHADAVVLDMKTPGGALDVTFDIMEALAKFPGITITFVDSEAMSAGAFIAASTGEIWFAPDGVIGAAAPVTSTGQDVDATMKLKVTSYLKARMRAQSEGKVFRGQVISAMIDSDYELKIGDELIKGKGSLLSLTATEAGKTYGDPAQPLLSAGVAKNIDDLLDKRFGAGNYTVKTLQVTWSEELASLLHSVAPILLGLGLLALYLEFKTPGLSVFGVVGGILLAVVFLGNYVAGLSGHEPMLVFGVGLVLCAAEIFFVPGVVVLALTGLVLMLGALVWSMADLWPNEPLSVAWSSEAFARPIGDLGIGVVIAIVLGAALARFLPRAWVWDRLVLSSAVDTSAQTSGLAPGIAGEVESMVGRRGVVVAVLRPSGQVEIDGRRYEARSAFEAIEVDTDVVVTGSTDFGLTVERADA